MVTTFSKLVGFLTNTYNAVKKIIDFLKNNPVTKFFTGASFSNASFVGANESQGLFFGGEDGSGGRIDGGGFQTGTPTSIFAPTPDSPTFTGAPLGAYSPAMQAAILRREELKAETERLRKAREDAAAARLEATGGQSTADRITVNFGVVGDPEAAARALVDVLNRSSARGGGGFNSLVNV